MGHKNSFSTFLLISENVHKNDRVLYVYYTGFFIGEISFLFEWNFGNNFFLGVLVSRGLAGVVVTSEVALVGVGGPDDEALDLNIPPNTI